ncbi:MAG: NgoFVII family restriction endonuclease [Psychromonas sp.]|nr:NgoFVII family restriction endonuclease [Psychromonas sp.]
MYFKTLPEAELHQYESRLKLIGQLSNLFSSSKTPYLYYRVAEKVYCECFDADDLSRGDVASDAVLKVGGLKIGVGLKTFLISNGKSFQKIAEFNKQRSEYSDLTTLEMVKKVSELRNNRISFTQNAYELDSAIYHCILRDKGEFKVFEEPMDLIQIDKIKLLPSKNSNIIFSDGLHEYNFNNSKSTLLKRFVTDKILHSFPVSILGAPFQFLEVNQYANVNQIIDLVQPKSNDIIDTLYLPLYGRNKEVGERSSLNQWNAKGRVRDVNEAYISVPALIHKLKPDFFPPRDATFDLLLPTQKILQSKLCQDGSKALMSYSNKELGKWILRDVLQLKERQLLTYARLQSIGIDAVRIDKLHNNSYAINFAEIGSYETFTRLNND